VESSVAPETLEAGRRQLGVAHRMRDVAVAPPILQRPRIVAGVRQGEAAGVPEHVAMDRERQSSTCATEIGCRPVAKRDYVAAVASLTHAADLIGSNHRTTLRSNRTLS
jgi:hypothetical protein